MNVSAPARPRFDPTFNYGHIFQAVAFVLTAVGGIWYLSAAQAEMRRDIAGLQARATYYAPKLDGLDKSQSVQDERISNMADAIGDQRKTSTEILTQLGAVRETLAGIKAQMPVR